MPDFELNETELAAGAALANEMAREDRARRRHEKRTQPSGGSALLTIAFVAIASLGMVFLMMFMSKS